MNGKFYDINGILVSRELFERKFVCDLAKCKGACCTMKSDYGAPLLDDEIEEITPVLDKVYKYLSPKSVAEIKKNGFWEKKEGTLLVRSIKSKDCVFVYYDGDIAKCAIEKAYNEGEIDFPKPVSCHLFPVRVSEFGGPVLRYEEYQECKPAVEKGSKENVKVLDFLKNALIRNYGKQFYSKLKEVNGK